jgi:hypothetical protein
MKKIALGLLVATAALSLSGCKKAEAPATEDTMEATEAAPAADESAAADMGSAAASDDASTPAAPSAN